MRPRKVASASAITWTTIFSLIIVFQVQGEQYSISQISPNSASNHDHVEPSRVFQTSEQQIDLKLSTSVSQDDDHDVVKRSANPILHENGRTSRIVDDLSSSRHFDETLDSNDVEVQRKSRYYNQIQPTRTSKSGEARGVPRSRSLSPEGPRQPKQQDASETKDTATGSLRYDVPTGRQSNPDIQDIITGIVKLLNGNVNVQANTQPGSGRPNRPPNTRINNRGPPRISDVPPLPPDFDTPGPAGPGQLVPPLPPQPSTKIPPPYPFDRPPPDQTPPPRPFLNGVPLPEQIVPVNQNYRPGFVNGRPQNLPPWQRPRPRPPQQNPNRRPNPNLPMYKPQPPNLGQQPGLLNSEETFTTIPHSEMRPPNENYGTDETRIPIESTTDIEEITQDGLFTQKIPENSVIDEGESFVKVRDPPTTIETISTSLSDSDQTENPPKVTTEVDIETEPTKEEILKDVDSDKKKQTMQKIEKDKPANKKQEQDKNKEVEIKNNETVQNASASVQPTPVIESSMIDSSTKQTSDSGLVSVSSTSIPTPTEGLPSYSTIPRNVTSSSSSVNISPTTLSTQSTLPPHQGFPYQPPYRGRPGIVLDDPEYRPGQGGNRQRPPVHIITSAPTPTRHHHGNGEIFDVTVSAIQGPGGGKGSATVHIESVNPLTGHPGDIIVSPSGEHGFVSIDGKRTYLNLFGGSTPTPVQSSSATIKPTASVSGTGYVVPDVESAPRPVRPQQTTRLPHIPNIPPRPRPQQPPVRIDTCIVGDDSTCDQTQNEKCKTEAGISSCQCRPGYARRNLRDPCRKVVAMVFSLRVDKMYDRKISWDDKLGDKESEPFQQLSYETVRAVDSAFSMTPYSDEFVSGSVNKIYKGDPTKTGPGVYVNVTVLLEESGETLGGSVGADITRHLLGVIQRRSNNVGASALWVDRPAGSVSALHDLDECSSPDLNDCHELATCTNIWGSFKCDCPEESRDAWADQVNRAGRHCHTCPPSHCSNRGTCSYRNGQPVCSCSGSYYGSQCEVDGEVVGVAVGASLAALVVILLTLACLVMWSRRWNQEQKAVGLGSPVFGYMAGGVKTPSIGGPPYQVSLEERMRWAQLADVMAQANHYAQPEPGHPGARPPSAMYGAYPTLPVSGTLPPVPMPRLGLHASSLHLNAQSGNMNTLTSRANTISGLGQNYAAFGALSNQHTTDSTSSESDSHAQDRTDLLGSRGFHVPRPKSRSNATNSIANQSGIYYDVDYENAPDPIYGTKGIPLSTYTMNRQPFYRQ